VQRSLHTSGAAAQLTMTTFLLGLAAGQLLCGPVSDSLGRRPMLLVSSVPFAVLTAGCALAPTVGLLLTARALEGLAGGCGVAVGRAVISDRFAGVDAAQRYGTLAAITLLAPIVAPAIGGVILVFGDWRAVFGFLTVVGVVMSAGVLVGVPETLPHAARHPHSLGGTVRRMSGLLRERAFMTPVLVQSLATAAFFTYIGGSSFVLQSAFGLSQTGYTVLFATNAAGMAAASATFRFTVRIFGSARLRAVGLIASTAAATALAGYALAAGADVALTPTWVLLAITVAGMGLCIPATTAIAQEVGRRVGGTASALQGGLTFGVGAAATPLTGLTGAQSVAGMAAIMSGLFLCALTALLVSSRRAGITPQAG